MSDCFHVVIWYICFRKSWIVAALRWGKDCSLSAVHTDDTWLLSRHNSNHIIKFTDDTTGVGLISDNDNSAYREEVHLLINWCDINNLEVIKEISVDFRKKHMPHPTHHQWQCCGVCEKHQVPGDAYQMTWNGPPTLPPWSIRHSNASTSFTGWGELTSTLLPSPSSTGVLLRASLPAASQSGTAAVPLLTRRPYKGWWGQQRRSADQPNHPSRTCTRPTASTEPPISPKTPPTQHTTIHPPTIWWALPLHAVQDYQTQQKSFPTDHQTTQLTQETSMNNNGCTILFICTISNTFTYLHASILHLSNIPRNWIKLWHTVNILFCKMYKSTVCICCVLCLYLCGLLCLCCVFVCRKHNSILYVITCTNCMVWLTIKFTLTLTLTKKATFFRRFCGDCVTYFQFVHGRQESQLSRRLDTPWHRHFMNTSCYGSVVRILESKTSIFNTIINTAGKHWRDLGNIKFQIFMKTKINQDLCIAS